MPLIFGILDLHHEVRVLGQRVAGLGYRFGSANIIHKRYLGYIIIISNFSIIVFLLFLECHF